MSNLKAIKRDNIPNSSGLNILVNKGKHINGINWDKLLPAKSLIAFFLNKPISIYIRYPCIGKLNTLFASFSAIGKSPFL